MQSQVYASQVDSQCTRSWYWLNHAEQQSQVSKLFLLRLSLKTINQKNWSCHIVEYELQVSVTLNELYFLRPVFMITEMKAEADSKHHLGREIQNFRELLTFIVFCLWINQFCFNNAIFSHFEREKFPHFPSSGFALEKK